MKLKLRAAGDVSVLTVLELQTDENLAVLRAGLVSAMKAGKNRFVLELNNSSAIPPTVLRELARLRLLANELSGDIVLAGVGPEVRLKIETFAKPSVIPVFDTVTGALQFFRPPAPPPPALPPLAPPPVKAAPPVGEEAKQFKEQIRDRELGEVGQLRKVIERLTAENRALQETLSRRVVERRAPADLQGYREKLQLLEAQLAEILSKPPEKKTGPA